MKFWTADVSGLTRTEVKAKLWEELRLKADIGTRGINISGKALDALHEDGSVPLQHLGGGRNRELRIGKELPGCVYLPYGLKVGFTWNKASPYVVDLVNGKHALTVEDRELGEVQYSEKPKYHDLKSSDGVPLELIGYGDFYDRQIFVTYSNECCYIDRDEDCLF
ncbi:MAG: nitrogen fixation protein NifB, partial [Treponema sp.]|nr:nitrogen fixation protein NifB [Treponema sp.]